MANKIIFESTGNKRKPGMNPVVGLLIFLLVIGASIVAYSNSTNGYVLVPGPGLLFILFANNIRPEYISAYVVKNEDGGFTFGYKKANGHAGEEFGIDECSYWYHHDAQEKKPPFFLVFKIVANNGKTYFLKETKQGISSKWPMENKRAEEGKQTLTIDGLEKMVAAIENNA
jgi:hypothetical protein